MPKNEMIIHCQSAYFKWTVVSYLIKLLVCCYFIIAFGNIFFFCRFINGYFAIINCLFYDLSNFTSSFIPKLFQLYIHIKYKQ